MKQCITTFAFALVVLVFANPADAQVSAADGAAFIGEWAVEMSAQGQDFTINVDIVDNDGMLAATVGGFEDGEEDVEDISLNDGALVLEYETSAQGQFFPVEMTLTPDGDDLEAELDIADGMFGIDGVATRR